MSKETKETPEQNGPEARESFWAVVARQSWLYDLGLILILLLAAYLRFTGLDWDQGQHLHPDERFLTQVESALTPVADWPAYFDTANSTLNPNNVNFDFFVYGTFPIFIVRYVAEWMDMAAYDQVYLVGRALAGAADLLVIAFVYLLGARLYDRRVGLFSAAFSAFAVLQIQISHYFTVDTFLTLFTLIALYLAVCVATSDFAVKRVVEAEDGTQHEERQPDFRLLHFILFGLALGMAVASKVTTVFVSLALPLAVYVRLRRLPLEQRWDKRLARSGVAYLAIAAVLSMITFRVFQPYAFNGPGFFDVTINEHWIDTLKRLSDFVSGEVDWPPSIQWARRGIFFGGKNLLLWGLGLPMGLIAFTGLVWTAIKMREEKDAWLIHSVPWAWTVGYFVWQSFGFNPTMRYFLPIYPTLALFAGWVLVALWDTFKAREPREDWQRFLRPAALGLGVLALTLTALYAFMFSTIYNRPVTRVAASEWIYQNVPGPLNLNIDVGDSIYSQPLSYPYNVGIRPDFPFNGQFDARRSGYLSTISYNEILPAGEARAVFITIYDNADPGSPLWNGPVDVTFNQENGFAPQPITWTPSSPIPLVPGVSYHVRIDLTPGATDFTMRGLELRGFDDEAGVVAITIVSGDTLLSPQAPIEVDFSIDKNVVFNEAYGVVHIPDYAVANLQTLRLEVSDAPGFEHTLAFSEITLNLGEVSEPGQFELSNPIELTEGDRYYFRILSLTSGGGVSFLGSAISVETTWDDGLPLRFEGFDGYGGIYQRDLNLDLYSDDTPEKRARVLDTLEQIDYITISSSRVWASAVQIPERYPMTLEYYRALVGCPENMGTERCYEVAKPGKFEGRLGFELVQVFQSDPQIGPLRINDQASEEAFTVYDHPKVFVFQKTAEYDHEAVTDFLTSVDISNMRHVTPLEAGKRNFSELVLPESRFARQQAGGTWSALFDRDGIVNGSPIISILIWYLALAFLGISLYPLVRRLLGGLPDKGYPLARSVGLLLFSYLAWLAGSWGVGFTQPVLWVLYFGLIALGLGMAYRQREELLAELRERGTYFLLIETLFLGFFLLLLFIRIGNPDLWHPSKGGEKPMDFAYFNAVLKSTTFPPYDPWFAGGYINYYYYGFVFSGALVKLLGIVPSTAYNLLLPTLFAMLSMGAFSAAWNLFSGSREEGGGRMVWLVGIGGAFMTAILGNLGTIRMMFQGVQRLGAFGEWSLDASIFNKIVWLAAGIGEMFKGAGLPYGLGDWYWIPSRAIRIPVEETTAPITEFPWFTFIYADLHAHMIAMPIAMIALGFVIAALLGKGWREQPRWTIPASIALGALAIGALYPTNTWDFPTYLALAVIVLAYSVFRYVDADVIPWRGQIQSEPAKRLILTGAAVALLAMLSIVLYKPYTDWYAAGYTQVSIWEGSRTPLNDYFTHWGLFLFVLLFWLGWETVDWMMNTPASALRKLTPYVGLIVGSLFGGFLLLAFMHLTWGVRIHWFALPIAAWAAVLLFRPNTPDVKRLMLFLVGTGLFLTVMVEVIVISGDIARMNTVFKFYLQVWLLFGVTSAAGVGYISRALPRWNVSWLAAWQFGLVLLLGLSALYPIFATRGKVQDRFTEGQPIGLDGMAFMETVTRGEEGVEMQLVEDYEAIRWMQDNVEGTPIIVEAQVPEYRWGSRFSIYTGLPAVLGWRWHQAQQRVPGPPHWIQERLEGVQRFYTTLNINEALEFLSEYQVEYIIVGQMERAYYPGLGLEKFERFEGQYWEAVFEMDDTVIYRVFLDEISDEMASQ
jgi:YYY domain-containing protein